MNKVKKNSRIRDRAYLLPSLVTVTSLFAGFLAIIMAGKGNFDLSVVYILAAFLLDGLDGRLARKLNAASDFGREFDSLCDLVAFGVAPAILAWEWAFKNTFDEFGILVSFLYVAGGATRLARFNITTSVEPKSYFIGLPIPAAAASLTAIVYAFPSGLSEFWSLLVMIYAAALGGLMVSTFKFSSFKRLSFDKSQYKKIFLVLAALVAISWKFNRHSIFLGMMCYIGSGVVPAILAKQKRKLNNEPGKELEESKAEGS